MPCWAAHTLYQLMSFKVMCTPPLPPLGFHYTCQVMHKVLICYNFFCFLHFQISGIDHSNVMFHLGSGGGLLVTCFFLSFRHCELHTPCKQRFLSGMAFSICKVIPGGYYWEFLGGGGPTQFSQFWPGISDQKMSFPHLFKTLSCLLRLDCQKKKFLKSIHPRRPRGR